MTATAPDSAAQALSGLVRHRPHGWLTTPMPTDPDALHHLAHQALERDHPGARGPLKLVSHRYTAAVFTLGDPPHLVLKLHADPGAYLGETLAYALLADTAPVARLHAEGPDSLSLLLEYLPEPADWTCPRAPRELAECVAAVHASGLRLPPAALAAMESFTLARLLDQPAPAWIRDPAAWNEVGRAHLEAYGPGYLPLGHLDLKPEHLRRRGDGGPALLDVETLRPDVTGLLDLVTLPAVYRQAGCDLSPDRVLGVYRDATARHGAAWTVPGLRQALRAFAAATGLTSLHGLDR